MWQAKTFEKFTAESPCERFQCLGIQEGEVSGSKGGYAGDVQINRLEAKENGFVVSTQALMTFGVHNGSKFVQAPP
ncbi:hypothetical protein B5K06_29390 [Rhizobium grahamii]|uniref:Uncharacterized protein n=2 Tax=Rhizobium grahamii TaxID=1120045 RepID=S3HCX3_9HYPH|nr:hypothetical protein RGCCGE502_19240 [Rhizobium grahamii CCGE 502]RDJ03522.1 hypothetical protein B5K06_29390 [Rhizobium grahamii]